MKKNVASQTIGAQMITAADGTAFTGTVSAFVTGDAGTQGSGGGTVTHEGNGYHSYAITQAETNFDHVAVTFTGTGAIPATIQVYTTFPQTGDNFARLGAPAGASVSADIAAVKAETASILTDTAEIGAAGAGLTALASQASVNTIDDFLDTEVAAILAAVDTEVAAIKAKTDSLTFTVAGQVDANMLAISGDATAADNLEAALDGTGGVTITAGLTGNVTGNLSGSVGSVTAGVSVAVGGIASTSFAAGAIDAAALANSAGQDVADRVLARNIAGGSDGGRDVTSALRPLRNRAGIAAGTLTVYQEDDVTPAWTAAVTTTAGDPLSEVDPT